MPRPVNYGALKAQREKMARRAAKDKRREKFAKLSGHISNVYPTGGMKQPPALGTVGRIIGEIG